MTTENTSMSVAVTGGRLGVHRREGTGPTLVFAHYWGGSARTWDAVLEQLPDERGTVRYDQRGWGAARQLPGPYHLDQLADDLLDLVAGLELDSFVLVGHSMGGKVCQLAAARRPSGLAGLVLLAPAPPQPPASVTADYCEFLAHAYDSAGSVRQALDHVLTASALTESAREAAVRDSLAADDPARRHWPQHGIALDITQLAGAIDVPVLVLAGEQDKVEPAAVLRHHLLPHIPHATLQVVPASGHLLPLEAPHAVAAALESFTTALHPPRHPTGETHDTHLR
ncbi:MULTISPECIES: alpha/beta fold hydrolase [Streptosporangium]|uniref:Pimeloyl-ACP methyl ester carboxylesterase n=1 Tax=Streptosporangium brasiliense TaxID=47480 RepID=A0ABT9RHM5_9ACTN|nr:alpha/beta hydrolase [Streptosporangium brasiliense]MDP9868772.1 pimeloyl-ACP methyl ester carboxylesterase [Streptosporangium brasiliense]